MCTYCCKVVLSYAQNPEVSGDLGALSEDLHHLSATASEPELAASAQGQQGQPATSQSDMEWVTPSKRKGRQMASHSIFEGDISKQRCVCLAVSFCVIFRRSCLLFQLTEMSSVVASRKPVSQSKNCSASSRFCCCVTMECVSRTPTAEIATTPSKINPYDLTPLADLAAIPSFQQERKILTQVKLNHKVGSRLNRFEFCKHGIVFCPVLAMLGPGTEVYPAVFVISAEVEPTEGDLAADAAPCGWDRDAEPPTQTEDVSQLPRGKRDH